MAKVAEVFGAGGFQRFTFTGRTAYNGIERLSPVTVRRFGLTVTAHLPHTPIRCHFPVKVNRWKKEKEDVNVMPCHKPSR